MRTRFAASVVIAFFVATVVGGCTFITPQTTLKPYDASDGVSAQIGDIKVSNMIAISADGKDPNLIFTAGNNGSNAQLVTIGYTAKGTTDTPNGQVSATIDVAQDGVTNVGYGGGSSLILYGATALAGTVIPIYVQYGDEPGQKLLVPVLNGQLPQYSKLVPTPTPTPTPSPTPTATPLVTPTPTPTKKP